MYNWYALLIEPEEWKMDKCEIRDLEIMCINLRI